MQSLSSANHQPTHSKVLSAFDKLTFKFRKTMPKSTMRIQQVSKQDVASAHPRVNSESLAILEHSSACARRKYDYQRSTKMPVREPAGFPINHNFSQRVIFECRDEESDDEIIPAPYLSVNQVLSPMPSSIHNKVPKTQTQSSSRSNTSNQTLTSRLGRTVKELFVSRSKKQSTHEFPRTRLTIRSERPVAKRASMHMLGVNAKANKVEAFPTPRSRSRSADWTGNHLLALRRAQESQFVAAVDTCSPTRFQTPGQLSCLMTPRLTSSLYTPSIHDDFQPSRDSIDVNPEDRAHSNDPMVDRSVADFSMVISSPQITPSKRMDNVTHLALQSPLHITSPVARHFLEVDCGSERLMMESPDSFSHELFQRPRLRTVESGSMFDRSNMSDSESLVDPFFSSLPR